MHCARPLASVIGALLDVELAPRAAFDSLPAAEAERAAFERLGELKARGQRIALYVLEP